MKKNRMLVVASLIFVIGAGGLGVKLVSSQNAGSAQPEVVPSPAQQKPILDLLAEQRRYNEQKTAEISGASRMLMSQLTDPVTKQVGLDPAKWSGTVAADGSLKFIQVPQTTPAPQSEGADK